MILFDQLLADEVLVASGVDLVPDRAGRIGIWSGPEVRMSLTPEQAFLLVNSMDKRLAKSWRWA